MEAKLQKSWQLPFLLLDLTVMIEHSSRTHENALLVNEFHSTMCDSWHMHHIYRINIQCLGCVCVCIGKREGGEFKGRGKGPGQHCGDPFKKGSIRRGIREVYLHQLSARLLGWRRSCDPPAIVLELPAGNNHIVIAGAVLTSSTGDLRTNITDCSLQERFRARIWTENYGVETVIREREENGHFYENQFAKMDMGKWLGLSNSGVCALYVRSKFVTEEFCGLHLVF